MSYRGSGGRPSGEMDEEQILPSGDQRVDNEQHHSGGFMSLFTWCFKPKVKVFNVVTGATFGAAEAILENIKSTTMSYMKVAYKKLVDSNDCDLILIFCPITSRAGSDVAAAMRKPEVVNNNNDIILVLMHHTRDPEYSTAGRKCSESYPQVKFEVNVLFHETQPGLLNCHRNDVAINAIKTEVYKYSKYMG